MPRQAGRTEREKKTQARALFLSGFDMTPTEALSIG